MATQAATFFKRDLFKFLRWKVKASLFSTNFFNNKFFKTKLFKVLLAAAVVGSSLGLVMVMASAQGVIFTVNSLGDAPDADAHINPANPGAPPPTNTDGFCDTDLSTPGNQCTLRAAIEQANATPGKDTINFDFDTLGHDVRTINVGPGVFNPFTGQPLPLSAISDPVTINGKDTVTKPDGTVVDGAGKIVLNGQNAFQDLSGRGDGLRITTANSEVRGLVINNFHFGSGIHIDGFSAPSGSVTNNQVKGNYIGTDASGNFPQGNRDAGVVIEYASNNVVGGADAADRNVIAGNQGGQYVGDVYIGGPSATGNQVKGNYIGTNAAGTRGLGFATSGIYVVSSNNFIGGAEPGEGNVISSGGRYPGGAVHISGAFNTQVRGNYIGTDYAGSDSLGNFGAGVELRSTAGTLVQDNVISGNSRSGSNKGVGIIIWDASGGNEVSRNHIGTDATGNARLGNFGAGVEIRNSPNNIVSANVIAFSQDDGVTITESGSKGNTISRNSIFSNGGLGIDLDPNDGVTPNDTDDSDTGPNDLQNYPILTSVTRNSDGTATIKGRLDYVPFGATTVQFFSNTEADPSGFGEGKTFVGETVVMPTSDGDTSFTVPTTGVSEGEFITATSTNEFAKGTSEFSEAVAVGTNTAPTAVNDAYVVDEDQTLTANAPGVLGNDTDAENNSLTAVLVEDVNNGMLTLNGDGSFAYTPNPDYYGSDRFTYKANDGALDSSLATVDITVNPVNDAPKIDTTSGDTTASEGDTKTYSVSASDIDGDTLSYKWRVMSGSAHISGADDQSSANVEFDDGPGSVSLKVDVSDGTVTTPTSHTFDVKVANVAPSVTSPENQNSDEGENKSFSLGSFTDPGTNDGPWHASIDWGDGSNATPFDASSPGDLTAQSHTYAQDGTYTVTETVAEDGSGASSGSATFQVTVANVAPTADEQKVKTDEDTTKSITLTGSDPGSDSLSFKISALPKYGKLYDGTQVSGDPIALDSSGSYKLSGKDVTYKPDDNYNGSDSFDFKADDDTADSSAASVSITVYPVNDPPVAKEDNYSTDEDKTLTADAATGVLANDRDVDDNSLTAKLDTDVSHGTLDLKEDGSFTYTPEKNYNGSDSFTYKVNDGTADSDTATVTITVKPVNDSPVAKDSTVTTDEDNPEAITLSGNDIDGDKVTFNISSGPTNGTLGDIGAISCDPTAKDCSADVTYTPNKDYNGTDSFTYKAADGSLESNEAKVTITLNSVNDLPTISDIADQSTKENTATDDIPFTVGDVETAAPYLSLEGSSDKQTLVPDANIEFGGSSKDRTVQITPASNQSGEATITVKVKDADGGTATATFKLTITAANQPPRAQNDSVTTNQDTAVNVDVLANDSDPDGDTLTINSVSKPSNGTASTDGKSVTYTPGADYDGPDSFGYIIDDGHGGTATATVDVTVVDNVAPSAPSTPDLDASSDTGDSTDNITSDNTPTFEETAEADSSVEIFANGTSLGSTKADQGANVDASGNEGWNFTPATPLKDGTYDITAKATDAAHNSSAASSALTVQIDTVKPDPPAISSPKDGTTTKDNTVSGTAEATSTVTVYDNGSELKPTVTADAQGQWTFESLSDGSHSITATATDAAGNASVASNPVKVTVDATPPAAPTIGSPANNTYVNTGSFAVSGTAEANSDVQLFEGTQSKGKANADKTGKWSVSLTGVAEGSHTYTARATDAAGNTSPDSNPVTVVVDKSAPTLTQVSPQNGATNVSTTTKPSATFSEDMDASTLRYDYDPNTKAFASTSIVQLYQVVLTGRGKHQQVSYIAVDATVSYDSAKKTLTLTPKSALSKGSIYVALITTGAKDKAGNGLQQPYIWYFQT